MLTRLRVLISRLRAALHRTCLDDEFETELQMHISLLTDQNVRRGMSPDEARRAARVTIGGLTQLAEDHRSRRGLPILDTLWQDTHYAFRILRRNPGFTLVAVLTAAIGVGVNTTAFTLIDAVALKPLPVANPHEVVRLERWFESGARGDVQYAFSVAEYAHFRAHTRLLSTLIAAGWPEAVVTGGPVPEVVHGQVVSRDYFSGLGIAAAIGRTFLPEEHEGPGAHPVIVLSDAFWRRRFQADALAVGRSIVLNDTAFTIVGVAPASFIGTGNPPQSPDFWAPLMMEAQLSAGAPWLDRPNVHRLQLLARVRPEASATQARAELEVLAAQLTESPETHQPNDRTIALTLQPAVYFGGTDDMRFRALAVALMAVVSMILLVACSNLANMLLARGAARQREIGLRLAIGATRGRIIRQLLTESLSLASIGGLVGILFAVGASRALWTVADGILRTMFLTDRAFVSSMSPDGRILAFAVLLSLGTGVLFGLSPALTISATDPGVSLKEHATRPRRWLIAGQMAVSTILLVCAGLLLRGLASSSAVDPGFDTKHVFTIFMNQGTEADDGAAMQKRFVEHLREAPEIEDVALVDRFPFADTWSPPVIADDPAVPAKRPSMRTLANYVSSNYFAAAGIAVRHGRGFTKSESDGAASVAVVSESLAHHLWPESDPLGKRLKLDLRFTGELTAFEVVGVVKDVRSANWSRVDPAYVYLPTRNGSIYNVIVRSNQSTDAVFAAVRAAVSTVDRRQLPSVRVVSLQDSPMTRVQMLMPKLLAMFAATLASLALVLAAIGIYGVTSYLVSQRTREIGVRMAVGGTARQVQRLIVRQGSTSALIGTALGLAGGAGISRLLQSMLITPSSPDLLFGVGAFDAPTFAGVCTFVAVVAVAASYVPAWRATRMDPLAALREE
jgi:putative ABC transport system permease protein